MINKITSSKRGALAAAALFHLMLVLSIFGVGRLGMAPQKFDRDGIGEFARDSRDHKRAADLLVDMLKRGELRGWLNSGDAFHVKIYSLSVLPLGPLLGSNILAVEPINLLCYLAILALTFSLGRIIAGERAAWLAALVVACWPSLVMHTTQFLRDPSVLTAVLTLMTTLLIILRLNLSWLLATIAVIVGAAAIYLVWQTRPEMWLVITAIIFVATFLLLIRIAATRKLLAVNLLAVTSLTVLSIAMPRPAVGVVSQPLTGSLAGPGGHVASAPSIYSRVARARDKFIANSRDVSGSLIDADVVFNSSIDVVKYVPRALEIGYFAPFPSMWFQAGYNVGLIGRILSGIEMLLTYFVEALACVFLWRTRDQLSSWLMLLATAIGMLALGLVVCNIGTLYRMRYPFWVLLVIMGAGSLVHVGIGRTPSRRFDSSKNQ